MSAQHSRCVAVYSRHFVASRINAPAVVVAVVFTLDHFVTTQTTMAWTKSLLDPTKPSVFDGQFLLGRLRASYCLLRTSHSPRSYCQCRGGFRHVQHVRPNRGPTKSGPHKRTKISFLIFATRKQARNIEIMIRGYRKRFCVARWRHRLSLCPMFPHSLAYSLLTWGVTGYLYIRGPHIFF